VSTLDNLVMEKRRVIRWKIPTAKLSIQAKTYEVLELHSLNRQQEEMSTGTE